MKRGFTFIAGMLMGAALFGGGTAYAAGLMAEPSSQTFYVDGQQIQLQAYAIGGNNYVKLRDLGSALDFYVGWDAAAAGPSLWIPARAMYRKPPRPAGTRAPWPGPCWTG